jgi:arylsulfatase
MDYKGRAPATAGIVLAVAAGALLACGPGGGNGGGGAVEAPSSPAADPAAPPPRPNVVLILADTLRADHLGAYGYARDTSPRFDTLAAESFLFEDVRAQAPCTYPSANSILTGRRPREFLGQPDGGLGIPETIPSIAEVLRGAGYATAAISASPIVRATPGAMNPVGGFARGFDRFSENCEWLDGSCVHQRASRFLEQLPEPFLLYLHYIDPHDPYQPPESWSRRFAGDGAGLSEATRSGDPNPISDALYKERDPSLATPEELAHLVDLYDDEIAYWDFLLGRLVDHLDHVGVLDDTLLVVLADHGESFFEHRQMRHCRSVYDTEIKTPLLIRLPPSLAPGPPRRIAAQAANLDVVPTLLDLLEIPAEGLRLAGASLRPAIEGREQARPPVFTAWHGLRAVKHGHFKMIFRARDGDTQLYDVAGDPAESEDLAGRNARELQRLTRHLREWSSGAEEDQRAKEEEAMERLRALGYVQ